MIINAVENFCKWYCGDRDKMLENEFQRATFFGLLKEEPDVILGIIREDLSAKITQYDPEFKEIDFYPIDLDGLSIRVFESLNIFYYKSFKLCQKDHVGPAGPQKH